VWLQAARAQCTLCTVVVDLLYSYVRSEQGRRREGGGRMLFCWLVCKRSFCVCVCVTSPRSAFVIGSLSDGPLSGGTASSAKKGPLSALSLCWQAEGGSEVNDIGGGGGRRAQFKGLMICITSLRVGMM